MMRDITIGQYYPAESLIHRLDPRVKLSGTMLFLIAVFAGRGIAGLLLITVFLAAVIRISKVPFGYMVKGLKAVVALMVITAFFNLFFTPGTSIIWEWKWLRITGEGVEAAVRMLFPATFTCVPFTVTLSTS